MTRDSTDSQLVEAITRLAASIDRQSETTRRLYCDSFKDDPAVMAWLDAQKAP
jgi:hypothetical protein